MNTKISFLDLKKQYLQIKDEVIKAILEVCENTAFSGGPFVEKFEKNFAAYCGAKYASGLNSGTSALHLALIAAGIKAGDEVIVPADTFIATAWAVSYVNATPVFVDCHSETWNIDPSKIEEKITPRTKAVIGVHLYGQPFDIDGVRAICEKHNLLLIEDCAQAQGAKYKGSNVGTFGEIGCFSFYPGKNLGVYGEAGGSIYATGWVQILATLVIGITLLLVILERLKDHVIKLYKGQRHSDPVELLSSDCPLRIPADRASHKPFRD